MVRRLCRAVATGFLIGGLSLAPNVGMSEDRLPSTDRMWHQLLGEANALGLPTKFLNAIPPNFIQFEFDDLHSYAAEYHPGEYRMVLNRSLSFNGAGATLRPLGRLTHVQMETLYHELFHAYLDYLVTEAEASPETAWDPVLAFARVQQGCHYGAVLITPVVQSGRDGIPHWRTFPCPECGDVGGSPAPHRPHVASVTRRGQRAGPSHEVPQCNPTELHSI